MPTAPVPITPYATPPTSTDSATFDARADAKMAQDVIFVGEANALGANVFANAVEAVAAAVSAAADAVSANASTIAAATSAGASIWVTGTTYAIGDVRWSPANGRIYRRRTAGAGATDPSLDPTNWMLVSAGDLQFFEVTGTTQAAVAGGLYALTNASATTVTGPAAAVVGDRWKVKPCNGRVDNIIDFNGLKHEGLSDSTMTLNGRSVPVEFIYISAGFGWGVF